MRFLAPLLLLACGPDLSGRWVGDPVCDGNEVDAELTLEKVDSGLFVGLIHLESSSDGGFFFPNLTYEVEVDYELELRVDGNGEQDLDVRSRFEDVDCGIFNGPDKISELCEDVGVVEDQFANREDELEDIWWNGADQLELQSDTCEGKLTRTAE